MFSTFSTPASSDVEALLGLCEERRSRRVRGGGVFVFFSRTTRSAASARACSPLGEGRGSVLGRVRILLFGVDVLLAGDVRDGDGFAVDHDAVVEPGETGDGSGGMRDAKRRGRAHVRIFFMPFSFDGWMGAHLTTTFWSGRVTTSPSKVTRPWRMKDLASERLHTPCLRGGVGDGREREDVARSKESSSRGVRTWRGSCRRVRAPRGRARVSCSYRARRSIRARRSWSP